MSRNTIIILVLLVPLGIWLNLYAYYKYGRSLIKKLPRKSNRQNTKIAAGEKKGTRCRDRKKSINIGDKKR